MKPESKASEKVIASHRDLHRRNVGLVAYLCITCYLYIARLYNDANRTYARPLLALSAQVEVNGMRHENSDARDAK